MSTVELSKAMSRVMAEDALNIVAQKRGEPQVYVGDEAVGEVARLLAGGVAADSALDLAAKFGLAVRVVPLLIQAGADVNRADPAGLTPLHRICGTLSPFAAEFASLLLSAGARVHAYDESGCTPLHVTATAEVASILLAAGAAVDAISRDEATPLLMACGLGNAEVASVLLAAGAAAEHTCTEGQMGTPLHAACGGGHLDVVSLLLEAGVAVEPTNYQGFTPLHLACVDTGAEAEERIKTEIISLLLAAGAAVDTAAAGSGITPLHVACTHGLEEIASVLLEAGAEMELAADNGATALVTAISCGHIGCVKQLSSYGASREGLSDGNIFGDDLTFSAEDLAGYLAMAQDEFPDVELLNLNATVQHVPSQLAGQPARAIMLWLTASRGWTPLHHLDTITPDRARALLRGGADPRAAAPAGTDPVRTPFDLARTFTEGMAERLILDADDPKLGPVALVLRAAEPWAPTTHELWPDATRARAVALVRLGFKLSQHERFGNNGQAIMDCWRHGVMPAALDRGAGVV